MDRLIGVVVAAGLITSAASAEVIFEHNGSNDPTTEAWIEFAGIDGDGGPTGDGRAWYVDDPSSQAGSAFNYSRTLTDCQATRIEQVGWTLRACARVDDPDSQATIIIGHNTGTRRYDMWLSTNAGGEPVVRLQDDPGVCGPGGIDVTLSGPGTPCHGTDYHLYELVYDPGAGSADLFIDGIERFSDYPGHAFGLGNYAGVIWGSGSSCADGYAEFRLVQFEINGPQPPVADINCDGAVDVQDLLLLLGAWGPCLGCDEDVNGSGAVDVVDLLALLGEWGQTWP